MPHSGSGLHLQTASHTRKGVGAYPSPSPTSPASPSSSRAARDPAARRTTTPRQSSRTAWRTCAQARAHRLIPRRAQRRVCPCPCYSPAGPPARVDCHRCHRIAGGTAAAVRQACARRSPRPPPAPQHARRRCPPSPLLPPAPEVRPSVSLDELANPAATSPSRHAATVTRVLRANRRRHGRRPTTPCGTGDMRVAQAACRAGARVAANPANPLRPPIAVLAPCGWDPAVLHAPRHATSTLQQEAPRAEAGPSHAPTGTKTQRGHPLPSWITQRGATTSTTRDTCNDEWEIGKQAASALGRGAIRDPFRCSMVRLLMVDTGAQAERLGRRGVG